MRKICLKKDWRYPTFDTEKVDFCSRFLYCHNIVFTRGAENSDLLLNIELLQYHKHNWIINVDLKMICILVSNMDTSSISAFCACETVVLKWSIGLQDLTSKQMISTFYTSHLLTKKIISLFQMKLGLMKQFVKALLTEGNCLKYLNFGISWSVN